MSPEFRATAALLLLSLALACASAEGISPEAEAWLDDTLVVMFERHRSLERTAEIIADFEPDLLDWHGGMHMNIGDYCRRRGTRVSGGAWRREYQEFVTWYDRDWRRRMQQFETNGVGRRLDGRPVLDLRTRYCASMCHNAPKWHIWHNQGLLMPVPFADTISQDNIDVMGFAFGRGAFCKWCLAGFRDYLGERFDAEALAAMGVARPDEFDFTRHMAANHPDRDERVLADPLCREYLKYQHISMLDNWRDQCRKIRAEADRLGVPTPPIYGNQYSAQSLAFGTHQCTEVDVVWIEDGTRLPLPGKHDAWGTLRYKIGLAAGGRCQPVWSCLYAKSDDARRTVLAEALANGGVHVANGSRPSFQNHARFVREQRHLFTRRERVASVGLIASPTTWMWGQFREIGLRENEARGCFAATARALEEARVPYGCIVLHHPDVCDEAPCLRELANYEVVIAPSVECLSAGQEAALRGFVERGGRLIVVGDLGKYDEDHVAVPERRELPAITLRPEVADGLTDAEAAASARDELLAAVDESLPQGRLVEASAGPLVWVNLWAHRERRLDIHLVNYDMKDGTLIPSEGFEMGVRVPASVTVSDAMVCGPDTAPAPLPFERDGDRVSFAAPAFESYLIISLGEEPEMAASQQLARATKAVARLRAAGETEAVSRFADALAIADDDYLDARYESAATVAATVGQDARDALARSVARKEQADQDERLARVARGREAVAAFDFGSEPTEGWRAVGNETGYDEQRGFGWLLTDALAVAGSGNPDSLHGDWIASEQPRAFRLDLAPGSYRVTVITGEQNQSYHLGGDVELTVNGAPQLVGIKRRGGMWRTDEFHTQAAGGHLDLTFSSRPAWWPMTYEHDWSAAGLIIEAAGEAPVREHLPLDDWLVAGPYDGADWTGIDAADGPPRDGPRWRYATRAGGVPVVDFRRLFTADDEAIFAARTALVADEDCAAELHIGLQARGKVWLNGELILHDERAAGLCPDEHVIPVTLSAGRNVLDVLTSTDWIGASVVASLHGAAGVRVSPADLDEAAGARPVNDYPEPMIIGAHQIALGVPLDVAVRFENLTAAPVAGTLELHAPDNADEVEIVALGGQEFAGLAPGATAEATFRLALTSAIDTVDKWASWSIDAPDTVKLVATATCGDQVRTGARWLPAVSPKMEARTTRAATGDTNAELWIELSNPTPRSLTGTLVLEAPAGWEATTPFPAQVTVEAGETLTALAELRPGPDVLPGEYPAQVTFSPQPAGALSKLTARWSVPRTGLAGRWRFDDGEGTVAADASPNHNDGAVGESVRWVEGHRDGALRFDASSWVVIPHSDSVSITVGVTVQAWVKPEDFVGNDMIVVKTDYSNEYLFYANSDGGLVGRVRCRGAGGKHEDTVTAGGALVVGQWQHVALTWSREAIRLYINGEQVKAGATSCDAVGDNASPLCIGGGAYTGGFHGSIDHVVVYVGALPPEDIRREYESSR